MKKSIFTFLIFLLIMTLFSSCATSKKGGCGCPGSSSHTIEHKIDKG